MKIYSYCLCFKWTNYLKTCRGIGMCIDDLRIFCLATPSIWLPGRGHLFLSFIVLHSVAVARCGKAPNPYNTLRCLKLAGRFHGGCRGMFPGADIGTFLEHCTWNLPASIMEHSGHSLAMVMERSGHSLPMVTELSGHSLVLLMLLLSTCTKKYMNIANIYFNLINFPYIFYPFCNVTQILPKQHRCKICEQFRDHCQRMSWTLREHFQRMSWTLRDHCQRMCGTFRGMFHRSGHRNLPRTFHQCCWNLPAMECAVWVCTCSSFWFHIFFYFVIIFYFLCFFISCTWRNIFTFFEVFMRICYHSFLTDFKKKAVLSSMCLYVCTYVR